MKSAIALLVVLALSGYAAAAVDLPWERFPEAELQDMEFNEDDEMSFEQGFDEFGEEEDNENDEYGFIEQSVQEESDHPTSETISSIQATTKKSIYVYSLTSGMVQAVFQLPNNGRAMLNLYNRKKDFLIHIDARVNWNGEKNTLVLNSKTASGAWQKEIRPKGFPFPVWGHVPTVTLRVYIRSAGFYITANGRVIMFYPYRSGLRPPVSKVEYYAIDDGASKKAKLKSLSVSY